MSYQYTDSFGDILSYRVIDNQLHTAYRYGNELHEFVYSGVDHPSEVDNDISRMMETIVSSKVTIL